MQLRSIVQIVFCKIIVSHPNNPHQYGHKEPNPSILALAVMLLVWSRNVTTLTQAHLVPKCFLRSGWVYMSMCSNAAWSKDLRFVEYFAGEGRVSLCVRLSGRLTASLDIKYHEPIFGGRTNFMDILSDSGMALPGLSR